MKSKGVIWSVINSKEWIIWKDILFYKSKEKQDFSVIEEVKSITNCLLNNIKYKFKNKK
jgi:hypothetical protein